LSLSPASRFAISVLAALLAVCSTAVFTAPGQNPAAARSVGGTALDDSGGVLPGVTVVAMSADGRSIATAVTDEAGKYRFDALPDGPIQLTFQLDGFAPAVVRLGQSPADAADVIGRLKLATMAETVVVQGRVPAPPLPPPVPVLIPVPAHDQESVCGPAKAAPATQVFGTIRSRSQESTPELYAKGDELLIDGGTLTGIEVGRNFVARRYYRVNGASGVATGEHSSGLLQIVAADERVSTAVVVYACDEMMKGDFLAAFTPEPVRSPEPMGLPVYDAAARILFADAGQMLGVPRRLMVIDQGSSRGIRAGQRLTLFRPQRRGPVPAMLGEAVVVAVRTDSATIRIENVTDAILFGDLAAPQRQLQSASRVDTPIEIGQLPVP
jgi:hypothetical protein